MLRNQGGRLRRPRRRARAAPARDAGCPPPRAGRKQPGGAREHLGWAPGRARRFRSCALPAYRCGGRGARARVTAPPAWPLARLQTRCWQRAGTREEEAEAPRLHRRARTEQTRRGETPRLPAQLPPELGGPRARRVPGTAGGLRCAAWTRRAWEECLFGTFFSGPFPERKGLVSGFSPLDFAPACGRLKGNLKRVSEPQNPLASGIWPRRVATRIDS